MFAIGALLNLLSSPLSLARDIARFNVTSIRHYGSLLREVSDRIRRSFEPGIILQTTVDEVARWLEVEHCYVVQVHPARQQLEVICKQASAPCPPALNLGVYALQEFGRATAALMQNQPFVSPGLSTWKNPVKLGFKRVKHLLRRHLPQTSPSPDRLAQGSWLLVPMALPEAPDCFLICGRSAYQLWHPGEVEFVRSIAQQLAIGLQQAQLYQQTQRQAQRESLINQITHQTRQTLQLEVILSEAIAQLLEAMSLDRCLVHLVRQPDHPELEQGFAPQRLTSCGRIAHRRQYLFEVCREPFSPSIDDFDTQGPITRWVIEHRQRVTISDTSQDPRIDRDNPEYRIHQIKSSLVVPVMSGKRLYAILYLNQCAHQRTWHRDDQKFAQTVADHLALSIQQASLFVQTQYEAVVRAAQAERLQSALETLQHTQAQLIQSEKMSSLGRVVAGLAHEINNPVSFIHGNIPYIEDYFQRVTRLVQTYQTQLGGQSAEIDRLIQDLDLEFVLSDVPKVLQSMQNGTERIRQVIVSLRNFSRFEEAQRKPADLHVGIENTILILQPQIESEITIQRQYGDLPAVDCYPGHLNQTFMNVLLNAVEALQSVPIEQPAIRITSEFLPSHLDDKPWVRITIADNGPGIPEEMQSKIFDPFFTTKMVGDGMGLGLSVCYYTIVHQHRGRLWVQSEVGQGSQFILELPVQHTATTTDQEPLRSLATSYL